MSRHERLAEIRQKLDKCKGLPIGRTRDGEDDFRFRERVNGAIDVFLAWLDYELTEEENS